MFPLLAINLETNAPPTLFWVWGAATLLLATALGFIAGATYAGRSAERKFRKAAQKLSTLYGLAVDSLDKSKQLIDLIEQFPQVELTAEQVDRLDSKRGSLLELLGRIVGKHRETVAKQVESHSKPKPKPQLFKIDWQRSSVDPATNLPDRTAFDANLRMMLQAGTKAGIESGLLLVRIDRMDQLRSRFGILGTDVFVKSMAAVISQAVREQDLVCRISLDSFSVLIPSVDADSGRKLSQAIRNSVRVHTFRMEDVGAEVLVTASFGYSMCPPQDDPELALSRVGDALAQSIRRGRNQLHVFDGVSVVHCLAG